MFPHHDEQDLWDGHPQISEEDRAIEEAYWEDLARREDYANWVEQQVNLRIFNPDEEGEDVEP